jgi:hypothetical protein
MSGIKGIYTIAGFAVIIYRVHPFAGNQVYFTADFHSRSVCHTRIFKMCNYRPFLFGRIIGNDIRGRIWIYPTPEYIGIAITKNGMRT